MTRTHLAITVELVSGLDREFWPPPGRVMLAARAFTFGALAEAVDLAFGRWDRGHLHVFELGDGGLLVGPGNAWDEEPPDVPHARSDRVKLSRLRPGEQFRYTFDLGDGWTHRCTVGKERVDPFDVCATYPQQPLPIDGWGDLPDQYGRQTRDGEELDGPLPDG
ncbi:MAG: hypothetical protein JWM67_2131 [Mycobacterium sp.]|nr:hypothetical protein [Mycobacterium sp.]